MCYVCQIFLSNDSFNVIAKHVFLMMLHFIMVLYNTIQSDENRLVSHQIVVLGLHDQNQDFSLNKCLITNFLFIYFQREELKYSPTPLFLVIPLILNPLNESSRNPNSCSMCFLTMVTKHSPFSSLKFSSALSPLFLGR